MEDLELLQIKSLAKNIRNDVMVINDETDDMSIRISVKLNAILNKLDYMLEVIEKKLGEQRGDKTKIEIKFKPNDYCYPIFLIGTKYKAFSSPICIDHIQITETQVFYISKRNEEFNERDCFDTKENAQNECNKRNDTAD